MKKCVIIGSGLGGLSCGCILAKNGYEVTILEQGTQIGGCLQCFRRGDAVFETGMHYIGSADPGQTLNMIWHYLDIDSDIPLERLNPGGYDVVSFQGEHYKFANGKENFIDTLAEQFPKSRDELAKYHDLIQTVVSSAAMHSLNSHVDINVNADYQIVSVNEVLDRVISDPLLRQVLAGIQPLYAGEKDRTPFFTHALIFDFYNQSAFRIVGGSSLVADALNKTLQKNGGKVLTRHKAVKIECDDSHATAVITANGERFPADLIISAIHPARTMPLIDSHLIRPTYRRRMECSKNTTAAFTVYLKFKKDAVRYLNSNLYYYRSNSTWGCESYDDSSWPKCILYMHSCHQKNPLYAETGEIITYMQFEEMQQWVGTHIGHRGEDYEAFKRRKAETVIAALEQEIPGISNQIERYYTSTPLTYLDYTDIPEGSMYGIAKDVSEFGQVGITSRTRIPNLLLTGQSITCHGMLGVLAGSLVTCSEVLTRDVIFSQIKKTE